MAATVLVREVLRRVSGTVQDLSQQFIRFPERECVDALNDGQMAIVKYLPLAGSRVDAIKLKAGSRQSIESIAAVDCKPGDGSTPSAAILGIQLVAGIMRNMGSDGLTPGPSVRLVSQDIMDSQNPSWHTVTGNAVKCLVSNPATPHYFYVYPAPTNSPAVWIEVPYTAQPIKIPNTAAAGSEAYLAEGASSLTISIADEFVDDLVHYCAAWLYIKNAQTTGNAEKAATHTNLFLASLNAKVQAITGTNPNLRVLPFAPTPVGQAA